MYLYGNLLQFVFMSEVFMDVGVSYEVSDTDLRG